jgi:hypothetical protein
MVPRRDKDAAGVRGFLRRAPSVNPLEEARRRRRARVITISAFVVTMVMVSAGAALNGRVPGVPLREGPLDGSSGITGAMPVYERHTGAIWGSLVLENRSGSTIVLDSVTVSDNPQRLSQPVQPYIWDEKRSEVSGFATVDHQLPLPPEWQLPAKHEVKGYILRSASTQQPQGADDEGYSGPDAEVLIEFGVPQRASTVSGITVRYHVGWLAYSKTFDLKLTLCPQNDLSPCGH